MFYFELCNHSLFNVSRILVSRFPGLNFYELAVFVLIFTDNRSFKGLVCYQFHLREEAFISVDGRVPIIVNPEPRSSKMSHFP